MIYYIMEEDTGLDNSIEIESIPPELSKRAILMSEYQYLDKKSLEIFLSKNSGEVRPDLCDYLIPLFSQNLKKVMDLNGVDNIFYKPIYLVDPRIQTKDLYWLAVPMAIDCVDWDNSRLEEGISLPKLIKFSIIESKVGNYKIFKLKNVKNQMFVITRELKEEIEKHKLQGIKFTQVEAYEGF
ncbi:imm11 family protein [Clostridium formicaceticum]|uniref:Immunity MXAN-0049 protein domain-containing protein n=1 Tax=Clostridium formicaceticum TaxID=1497 RepID=A0AAC9RL20_9CLOT|nr:DUF1629 domain-containing protein [Clostridium formicaceticum]AOY74682.1 hypothetical protein BJL90_01160 [Clostridium formicaceticum]ARE89059.1 hypothetical protein CLFO_34650 [Clostridium formicaceticum]